MVTLLEPLWWMVLAGCGSSQSPQPEPADETADTHSTVDTAPPTPPEGYTGYCLGADVHIADLLPESAGAELIVSASTQSRFETYDYPPPGYVLVVAQPLPPPGRLEPAAALVITADGADGFGGDVEVVGDVNGNGTPDLAVTHARGYLSNDDPTLWVFDPSAGPDQSLAQAIAEFPADDRYHHPRPRPCGDHTDDGIAELCVDEHVVLGPIAASTETARSRAWTTYQGAGGIDGSLDDGTGATLLFSDPEGVHRVPVAMGGTVDVATAASHQWSGARVSDVEVLGDLDGDGTDELLGYNRQQAWMFSSQAPAPLADSPWRIDAELRGARSGDLDQDGTLDLAVVLWDELWIFSGPLSPGVLTRDDTEVVEARRALSGAALAVGDLDSDGRDDVAASLLRGVDVLWGGGL